MSLDRLRILGSGFTDEEYRLYRFDQLPDARAAMRFLSNRRNHDTYRPAVNTGAQQHILEDKWATHLFLSGLNVPVPRTWGLYHPRFGATADGAQLRTPEDLATLLEPHLPLRLIFKPRGGRKGRHIVGADLHGNVGGGVRVTSAGAEFSLADFLATLPDDAFGDYDGHYHGWVVQERLDQHSFLNRFNPDAVNTVRLVTFISADGAIDEHLAVLRLGRAGGVADNWDKGGISVGVDVRTGMLRQGVFKPRYGGGWTSVHPDTGERFEGEQLPEWPRVLDVCRRAAIAFSGVRAVGWDVALTPDGPVIIEGNATWDLPMVQVHTNGYLSDEIRAELARYGARFLEEPHPLPLALLVLLGYQWQRSRGPRLLASGRERMRRVFSWASGPG